MVYFQQGKLMQMDPSAVGIGEAPASLLTDRIVVGLMGTAFVFNAVTQEQYDDISANGIVATGYIEPGNAGSLELATKTIARNDGSTRVEFDADNLVFSPIGNGANDTFDQIILAREQDAGITEANTQLIAHASVGATTTNGGAITLNWSVDSILQLT